MKSFRIWAIVVGALCAAPVAASAAEPVRPVLPGTMFAGEDEDHLEAILLNATKMEDGFPRIGWISVMHKHRAHFTLLYGKVDCAAKSWSVTGLVHLDEAGDTIYSGLIPVGENSFQPFEPEIMAPAYYCDHLQGKTFDSAVETGGTEAMATWATEIRQQWQAESQ